jgi:hypothetical protein
MVVILGIDGKVKYEMGVIAVECDHVKWINLTQDRDQRYVLVNILLNTVCFIKYREFHDT